MAKKYGLFRFLVAKHFLSKSLEEIESFERKNSFDLPQLVKLLLFSNTLDKIFPDDSLDYNMGLKFHHKIEFIYKNTYNEKRAADLCDYKQLLDYNEIYKLMQCNQDYLD